MAHEIAHNISVAKDDKDMRSCTKYILDLRKCPRIKYRHSFSPGYRKFVCGACIHVSDELQENCKRDSTTITTQSEFNVVDTMLEKVQKELSISKEVIKNTEMTLKLCINLQVTRMK